MKRLWSVAVFGTLLTVGGALLYADSSSTLRVNPSEMTNGEEKTLVDDGRTIHVRRDGDAVTVRIEGGGKSDTLVISRSGDTLRIGPGGIIGRGAGRELIVTPERRRIIIDGTPLEDMDLPDLPALPRHKAMTWFVCPKDHTTLRVPDDKTDESFKCPVDGTQMEKRKGQGFSFFFDNDSRSEM